MSNPSTFDNKQAVKEGGMSSLILTAQKLWEIDSQPQLVVPGTRLWLRKQTTNPKRRWIEKQIYSRLTESLCQKNAEISDLQYLHDAPNKWLILPRRVQTPSHNAFSRKKANRSQTIVAVLRKYSKSALDGRCNLSHISVN